MTAVDRLCRAPELACYWLRTVMNLGGLLGRANFRKQRPDDGIIGLPWNAFLQTRIDRLAFEREDAKYALVHSAERFLADKSFECFNPKGELSQSQ